MTDACSVWTKAYSTILLGMQEKRFRFSSAHVSQNLVQSTLALYSFYDWNQTVATMPRSDTRGNNKRTYGNFTEDDLLLAVDAVKSGMSLRCAANQFNINLSTLHYNLNPTVVRKPGSPPVLSDEEETVIRDTIKQVTEWGLFRTWLGAVRRLSAMVLWILQRWDDGSILQMWLLSI